MTIELSCAFATSPESHEHARIAESLGYRRAFFYDSPALYPDVWVQLCRAAERTKRIGLGPGVLIPSLRHPMTNAAAIATLAGLAGAERVVVGVGSGFTGRMAMGQRALRWNDVTAYVRTLRGLLRGEQVMWEGKPIQMLHTPGFAPPRPLEVPFIIAVGGAKGIAVAREVGDGVFGGAMPIGGFPWSIALVFGTVLEGGEEPGAERPLAAAGHADPRTYATSAPWRDDVTSTIIQAGMTTPILEPLSRIANRASQRARRRHHRYRYQGSDEMGPPVKS